jgi:uncharacterized membrane protein YdjX (TVP38/TMEM64 family)
MSDEQPTDRSGLASRLLLGLLAFAGLAILVAAGGPRQLLSGLAAERAFMQDLVARWGALSVLAFIACYAGLMMLLWIPPWLCTVIGGMLFGRWLGATYAALGATLGAIAVFLLSRLGIGNLARRAAPFLQRAEALFHANELSFVLVLRLVPVMPFAIVNVASGVLRVRIWTFVVATVLGIIPSSLIYASLGVALLDLAESDAMPTMSILLEPGVLLPLIALAALALAPVAYGWLRGPSRG